MEYLEKMLPIDQDWKVVNDKVLEEKISALENIIST
jgi:hypothetical protein